MLPLKKDDGYKLLTMPTKKLLSFFIPNMSLTGLNVPRGRQLQKNLLVLNRTMGIDLYPKVDGYLRFMETFTGTRPYVQQPLYSYRWTN